MQMQELGVQIYTVRDHLGSRAEFERSIERLRQIGYSAIELIPSDRVTAAEMAQICRNAGLTVAAAHVPGQMLLDEPAAIVERLQTLGTDLAVYPFPAGIDLSSRAAVEHLADRLEAAAAVLGAAGQRTAYHNHAFEFFRLSQFERSWDVLINRAPNLQFELDPYWAQYAGVNPAQCIGQLGSKLVSLHLKDFGVSAQHGQPPVMKEVGSGNLDFSSLIPAARDRGCRWFIVEQDITPGDPFASLEQSFRFLAARFGVQ